MRTYPAAVDAAAVPVLINSWAVASKLVRTTSPASMIRFSNGRLALLVGVGAVDVGLTKTGDFSDDEAGSGIVTFSNRRAGRGGGGGRRAVPVAVLWTGTDGTRLADGDRGKAGLRG
jgi:hypothetical protein